MVENKGGEKADNKVQADNKELFINKGIKNTNQRNIVYNVLKQANAPMTAEQLFFKIKNIDAGISLSTIYRILDVFVGKGMVRKISLTDDNKAMYELECVEHRHHLICVGCKKMTVVDNCPFETYEKSLEQKTSFHITAHNLEIYGYCPLCKAKEQDKD